ncbi:sugar ABC transporter permease [Candidatus Sumerlaeota bacterium]|nr:sugar ABC transporter permease [Candidatus Sumerlaeota bacterium]
MPDSLPHPRATGRRENAAAYLHLAPAGVILLVFWFVPVLLSFAVSFTNWEGADTLDLVRWVGARNYLRTLRDHEFWLVVINTFNYVLFSVPLTLGLGLGFALILHRKFRGSGVFRTLFFLPYVSTWVAVSIVWRYFFDIQVGPLNYLLHLCGADPLKWLQEPRGIIEMFATGPLGMKSWPKDSPLGMFLGGPSLAMTSIIVTSVWRDVGFCVVIFLAGLNNIEPQHYEAAKLDGAGGWARFRHITWPLLSPSLFFLLVVSMIGAFRVLTPVMIMTPEGGPAKTTSTIVFYLYQKGFVQWRLGLASAVAYLLFLILFTLTILQNRLLGSRVHYEQ